MKKLLVIIASLVLALTTLSTFAGENKTLPKVEPPTGKSRPEITIDGDSQTVAYWIDLKPSPKYGSGKAEFRTDFSSKLLNIRLVISDATAYDWVCQYDKGQIVMDGKGNGIQTNNTVEIDRMGWMSRFREFALPPIEYYPPAKTQTVQKLTAEQEYQRMAGKAFAEAHWKIDDASPKFEVGGIGLEGDTIVVNGVRGIYNPKEIKILSVSYDHKDRFLVTFQVLGGWSLSVRSVFLDIQDPGLSAVVRKLAQDLNPNAKITANTKVRHELRALNFFEEPEKVVAK